MALDSLTSFYPLLTSSSRRFERDVSSVVGDDCVARCCRPTNKSLQKAAGVAVFPASTEQSFGTGLRPVRSAGRIKVGAIDAAELGPFKK